MNMAHRSDEELSDDEVFFGKLTLKKIKKLLFFNNTGQNTFDSNNQSQDNNTSVKIIEAHSQPNLLSLTANVNSPKFSSVPGSPALYNRLSDDSFIQMENMVSKLCSSPGQDDNLELNNTFEVIDYILKKGPNLNTNKTDTEKAMEEKNQSHLPCISPKIDFTSTQTVLKERVDEISAPKYANNFTPAKSAKKQQAGRFVTPASSVNLKAKTPVYKTPVNLFHNKLSASAKKTPGKTNVYQHIASPIAAYIKNSPQVPLVKDVYPRKPLPVPSSIPKPIKNPCKLQNKENVNLPSVAYKSAKKTKVITLPEKEKLPQSQWVKKIMSTCPRATVTKHENREIDFTKKPLINQKPVEDSFADLSVMQAELSVCTQKSAFKTKKHY